MSVRSDAAGAEKTRCRWPGCFWTDPQVYPPAVKPSHPSARTTPPCEQGNPEQHHEQRKGRRTRAAVAPHYSNQIRAHVFPGVSCCVVQGNYLVISAKFRVTRSYEFIRTNPSIPIRMRMFIFTK